MPRLLRAADIELTTMREHYGERVGQRVDDVDGLIEIADREWIGFCKDAAIKRNEAERATVSVPQSLRAEPGCSLCPGQT